jgi:type III pantothenate kinase
LSNVNHDQYEVITFLKNQSFYFHELTESTPIPVKNLYKTPSSLGKDRIALAVGGAMIYKNKNILIIDVGTCITYDFVNDKNEYLGGGISPGIDMRLKSLHQFTAKLPLVEKKEMYSLIGNDTHSSILSGVLNGATEEVKGIIQLYQQQFNELNVILTGGDYIYFATLLKNTIFADQYFLLKGLNQILEYVKKT